jgi:hypothetical protein
MRSNLSVACPRRSIERGGGVGGAGQRPGEEHEGSW